MTERIRLKTYIATEDMDPSIPAVINRDPGGRITSVVMTHESITITKSFTWDAILIENTGFSRVIVDNT